MSPPFFDQRLVIDYDGNLRMLCIIVVSKELPPLDDEVHLALVPEKVLMGRERKSRNITIKEYLVQWKGFPSEDATWEGEQILQHPTLLLL